MQEMRRRTTSSRSTPPPGTRRWSRNPRSLRHRKVSAIRRSGSGSCKNLLPNSETLCSAPFVFPPLLSLSAATRRVARLQAGAACRDRDRERRCVRWCVAAGIQIIWIQPVKSSGTVIRERCRRIKQYPCLRISQRRHYSSKNCSTVYYSIKFKSSI
jgi:hypothetical protein